MVMLSELPVGSYVKDANTKSLNETIIWRVVNQNGEDSPLNSTTLFSKNLVDLFPFDSPEPTNTNALRKTYGNNRWAYSNLRQWLNARGTNWFNPLHPYDALDSKYSNKPGFLTSVSSEFEEAVLTTTVNTKLSNTDGSTGTAPKYEATTEKFFVPSMTEMYFNSTVPEGKPFQILRNSSIDEQTKYDTMVGFAFNNLIDAYPEINNAFWVYGGRYQYWMRSALQSMSQTAQNVTTTTGSGTAYTNGLVGVKVVCNMRNDIEILGQDTDGVYVLKLGSQPPIDGGGGGTDPVFDISKLQFTLKDGITQTELVNNVKIYDRINLVYGVIKDSDKVDVTIESMDIVTQLDNTSKTVDNKTVTEYGKYTVVLKATQKDDTSKTILSKPFIFTFTRNQADLPSLTNEFKVYDNSTNSEIIVTEGKEFFGKASIYLKNPSNTSYTVSAFVLKKGGTSSTKLTTSPTVLTDISEYIINYQITDVLYPSNFVTGSINFVIKDKPITDEEFSVNIKLKEELSTLNLTGKFVNRAKPKYEVSNPRVLLKKDYILLYEGSPIAFKMGDTLTRLGTYQLTTNWYDSVYPDGFTKTIVSNFRIVEPYTDLEKTSVTFVDLLNERAIISDYSTYQNTIIQPMWDENLFTADMYVRNYVMKRDGSEIQFNAGTSTVSTEGLYEFTIQVENSLGETKDYTVVFTIKTVEVKPSELQILNDLDNQEIYEEKKFEDQRVIPVWEEPLGFVTYYTLEYSSIPLDKNADNFTVIKDFFIGFTELVNYGTYKINITIESEKDPSISTKLTRTFYIVPIEADINAQVTIKNLITNLEIKNNDKYKGISVKPVLNINTTASIGRQSFITYAGFRREYFEFDDSDVCTDFGEYVVEWIIFDNNFPENFKTVSRIFTILPSNIDLDDKSIVITDNLVKKEIQNGQIYRGKKAKVQPTWVEYSELEYSYELKYVSLDKTFNGIVNDYKKGDILTKLGNYNLSVKGYDPFYPKNFLYREIDFSLLEDINIGDVTKYEEAYLNGLPYKLGTPIVNPGLYNLIVTRSKDSNFMYSMKEINFTVVDPQLEQLPFISVNPEYKPSIEGTITIKYPASGDNFEYKIDDGNWRNYSSEFTVKDNCLITARYTRYGTEHYIYNTKQVTNIDKRPPEPPVITGFLDNVDTYLTVTPNVKYVYGVDFTATLDGKPYELGTPIFNEKSEVRQYTIIVTAKKKLNGLTASVKRVFNLDSVPPEAPKLTGFVPYEIQKNARPDVSNKSDKNNYETYLNNNRFTLGNLVSDPDTYVIGVTAIKKINGLRTTTVSAFTIVDPIPEPIGPNRFSIEPLLESNKERAVDGELVVDLETTHISIYDDGYLMSKTKELENLINTMNNRIVKIKITLESNEQNVIYLENIKDSLEVDLKNIRIRNNEISTNIKQMESFMKIIDLTNYKDLETLVAESESLFDAAVEISYKIREFKENILVGPNKLLNGIRGLMANSSLIAEAIWYKNNI